MPHVDVVEFEQKPSAEPGMKLVGDLACQADSYLRSIRTTVVQCIPAAALPKSKEHVANAVPPPGAGDASIEWFAVQLLDTVLFAEGGGQPWDTGRIGDAWCGNVQRVGMEVWHFVDRPLQAGAEVDVVADWDRRWDHTQQHSGQHLLTSVVEQELGLETVSWGLGKDLCHIQLGVNTLSKEQIENVECICNARIRDAMPVEITVISDKEAIREHSARSSRGIPGDITGPIRLVDMGGFDKSTCCGTHVRHLAHLQLLRVLHFEPKGNTMKLFFVVGARAMKQSQQMYSRERALVKSLGTNAEDMANAVDRIKKSSAESKKNHTAALKELAPLVGAQLAASGGQGTLFHHRDDADMSFLMVVADKVLEACEDRLVVLSQGDRRQGGEGQLLIAGPEDRVAAAAQKAAELTLAKGGVNKGRWRGKMPSLKKLKDLEKAGL